MAWKYELSIVVQVMDGPHACSVHYTKEWLSTNDDHYGMLNKGVTATTVSLFTVLWQLLAQLLVCMFWHSDVCLIPCMCSLRMPQSFAFGRECLQVS